MAFTEFVCRSGGSNMNGGALAGNGEPATTPVYSTTNGGWNSGTGVFTPSDGSTPASSVTVGDFAHVFTDGSTTPTRIARVTAVAAGVNGAITLSTTAGAGTAPTTAGSGVSIRVGGAWAGPSGATIFPFGFVTGSMTNAAGNTPRWNFKNDQTYNVTASCAHSNNAMQTWQGYSSTFGDLGKATFDAGGNAIVILNVTGQLNSMFDFIAQNNGATNVKGIICNGNRNMTARLVANNIGGMGIDVGTGNCIYNSEAYACNGSNTASNCGINAKIAVSCTAHDNTGSNSIGIIAEHTIGCIAESNGSHGIQTGGGSNTQASSIGCDVYNNGGDGIRCGNASSGIIVRNCNLVKNTGFGIGTNNAGSMTWLLQNNGYGSGSMANGSGDVGTVPANSSMVEVGKVTYASGLTPWVDPDNGDFRISLAAAKGAGFGGFTQTAPSYAGTVGYPDIGAAQHQETASSSGGQRVYG